MCFTKTVGYSTCAGCFANAPVTRVRPFRTYQGVVKNVVHEYKTNAKRAVAADMVRSMRLVGALPKGLVVVPMSTATSRMRIRGFDHAKHLARLFSVSAGVYMCPALARTSQSHQAGASRRMRYTQTKDPYRVAQPSAVAGRHVLLIDDIVTTGASLAAAARALMQAGALSVSAVTYAQTPIGGQRTKS